MRAPKWLSNIYQQNTRIHLLLAPLRHRFVALRNFARPTELHQAWGTTAVNRRPKLVQAISEIVPDGDKKKVLSYGCSTGEELVELRQKYHRAQLFGTDLNRTSLRKAKTTLADCAVELFVSTEADLRRYGPYDLIVACSVFIRHPEDTHTDDLSRLYPFRVFEKGILRLFENIKPGGLMCIHNANYRVMDTDLAASLRAIRHPDVAQSPNVPLFASSGRKLSPAPYEDQLFLRER